MPSAIRIVGTATFALVCFSASWLQGDDKPTADMDVIQGNWEGEWTSEKAGDGKLLSKVLAQGKGDYLGFFTAYDGGGESSQTFTFSIRGSLEQDRVTFSTTIPLGEKLGTFEWKSVIKGDKHTGTYTNNRNYTGGIALARVTKNPEQIGAKPLPGAIVLFDGKDLSHWKLSDAERAAWKVENDLLKVIRRDKVLGVPGKHLASRIAFQDAQIHLEYRTPYLPEARGQERGQSGVFLQGRFEIQILDSFAGGIGNDAAGAIFKHQGPSENVCLPPTEWQSLDILYVAPRYDDQGKQKTAAEITVTHNGTLIHDRVKISVPTEGAPFQEATTEAGLILEDASQAVEFRNIWVVKLNG